MKGTRKEPHLAMAAPPSPLRTATPEALAKALLRPLTPPDPSLRKSSRSETL